MVTKVATTGLPWSQPILHHSPSSSRALASAVSSFSSYSRRTLVCRRYGLALSPPLPGIQRSCSVEFPRPKLRPVRRSCSASLESFSDEEFSKKIQELALRFQLDDGDEIGDEESEKSDSEAKSENHRHELLSNPPNWSASGDEITPASIERRANSVDLPVSLRMIKRKKMMMKEAGESALCSVKKAFSSMVFIIRELHSFSIQMRELLFYEDLQGILERVQREMHASFVWLFQQVFSHTPTLMVYVMILLANFTVYSLGHNIAPPNPAPTAIAAETSQESSSGTFGFDSSAVKTFSISGGNKTTSVGGGSGGGGKASPVASGFDGGASEKTAREATARETEDEDEEETKLWESMVEEASAMRDEALDSDTVRNFVAPVNARIDSDGDYEEFAKTELNYLTNLAQDPNNALLLVNYAQFLYLVAHNFDRAEEYFKRATKVIPADPAAHSKYATFLWRARNDLWAAEEAYLEAISADSTNSVYAADYAHFLWNTGGEETCFPLDSSDDSSNSNLDSY